MMDKLLLAAETAADEAEVYLQKIESTDITFQNGALEKIENEQTVGVALRILKNGRLGFAYTTNHGEWSRLLENALASAEIGEEVGLSLPVTASFSPVTAFSSGIKEIGAEGMVSEGLRVLEAIGRLRPGITVDCYLGRTVEQIKITNSKGTEISHLSSEYYCAPLLYMKDSGSGLYEVFRSLEFRPLPTEPIEELATLHAFTERHCTVPTRRLPVLFTHRAVWALLWRLRIAISGQTLVQKVSPLMGRRKEKVFHEAISVYDDPQTSGNPLARPFDDEGVSTAKRVIVQDGVFLNFLYDLRTAAKLGEKSSGNGYKVGRGFMGDGGARARPSPAPRILTMRPGAKGRDEMIRGMEEGIVVDQVLGAHSGNLTNGDYSMGVGVGYYVKNGEIQGRAADTMVAGNIYEDLQKVSAVENRLHFHSYGFLPSILLEDISVSGG
jgi:PmbA protein